MPERFKFQMESMFLVLIFSKLVQREDLCPDMEERYACLATSRKRLHSSSGRVEDTPSTINLQQTSLMLNVAYCFCE